MALTSSCSLKDTFQSPEPLLPAVSQYPCHCSDITMETLSLCHRLEFPTGRASHFLQHNFIFQNWLEMSSSHQWGTISEHPCKRDLFSILCLVLAWLPMSFICKAQDSYRYSLNNSRLGSPKKPAHRYNVGIYLSLSPQLQNSCVPCQLIHKSSWLP